MKMILTLMFLLSLIYGNESEKFFWDEVKNSSDIEMLKSYKKQYPHGIFEKLADIKIRRLQRDNETVKNQDINEIPLWIKGTTDYDFYGVGKANKHFKGKDYQENLARSRANRKLQKLFDKNDLTNETMQEYKRIIEKKKYIDTKGRIYILLYIDNYNL